MLAEILDLRVLLLVKRFAMFRGDSKWLTDELAEYVNDCGRDVDVFFLDFESAGKPSVTNFNGICVYRFPVNSEKFRRFLLPIKILAANFAFAKKLRRKYDVVINFSILSVFFPVIAYLKIANRGVSIFSLIWDFFPIHQVEINRLKKSWVTRILYYVENRCILWSNSIGVMSEEGERYLKKYHANLKENVNIVLTPVWGQELTSIESTSLNIVDILDDFRLKLVFGGQISKGRGIEDIVKLFVENPDLRALVQLIVIGPGGEELRARCASEIPDGQIVFLPRMPREDYLAILSECDVGLVSTVSCVSVPTFPSKVIDYMRMAKPVIASVESTTDFSRYIEETYQCGIAVQAGDAKAFMDAVEKFRVDEKLRLEMGRNGKESFSNNLNVKVIGKRILESVE